jgi:hypothetical protein
VLDFVVVDEPPDRPLPDRRASDADRERAVAILGRAASDGRLEVEELEERLQLAYAARTHAELGRLLADVGTDVDERASPGAVGHPSPGAAAASSWVVSVMGGSERSGRWRVGPRCTVVNVMGGSELDLNDAELTAAVTRINVYSVMGGCEIRVPDGVEVQVSKFALMGGHGVALGDEVPPAGAPVIRIRLLALMGGGEVRRGRKPGRRKALKDRALDA